LLIEGSPYNRLIDIKGEPLSSVQKSAEDRKLQQATERRRNESVAARQKRIAEYRTERHQDHAFLTEMVKAFDFKLAGEEGDTKGQLQPFNPQTQVLRVCVERCGVTQFNTNGCEYMRKRSALFLLGCSSRVSNQVRSSRWKRHRYKETYGCQVTFPWR